MHIMEQKAHLRKTESEMYNRNEHARLETASEMGLQQDL
jgi:hypothetical protein